MTRSSLVGLAVPWAVTDYYQIDVHGVVCEYFEGEGLGIRLTRRPSGVSGVLVEGIIDAIWAFPGSTAQTAEGIVAGETEAGVLATYGSRAHPVPNPYTSLPDYMIDATGWGDLSPWYAFLIEGGASWAVLVSSDGYPPGGCA